ncbi:arabinan endo-1,5-alpha-L-arabinosidase [Streptomyces rapamycinicus]|uniref:Arabinan endo-1,5-alpha-L-arabinosidase n=2 Tax=Streptomyces rapamycinicus TaxID=1226757 RepID=A0A0A0N655_STRRN|nr:arabinan endo-1,5-alpha-L-arabinosidase [Streptomyces rapamycinicus]AGP52456.1 arabinan endo-1,5-alpha-L-arabinosidase [Streptomyces rapamycinicus NRRL 5491]MBB4779924.1 arabinan endo-1,5-alpha-L-arabinosidase [Streptomyces rapamycinicus]RLV75421.1 arabinan endo-1,5-alpha-L-arabinosidase [Streptomyces rapamycinicus NRRL 5491]UTP28634.1 arabinan endo-1,5-alpha-L-arabinosidase [Streptomyces rapamycinicus NRRL 5491]
MKAHRATRWLPLPTALLLALLPTSASAYPNPGRVTGDTVVHDPSMVRAADGTYLLYSTHGGLEARTSTDRIAFSRSGSAFTTPPSWWRTYSADNDPWAPDISYQAGGYLMYYAVSSFGASNSAIGLATSPSGRAGTWTDRGIVHSTTVSSDYNAIDPSLFVDSDGKWWLSFGSWWSGLKMIRLDPATGKQYTGDRTVYAIASRPTGTKAIEGPSVVKRNGYYYLFASYDTCCAGTSSTYKIKVGRATSPTGPYYDKSGVNMMNNGGTPVLESHGRYIGPGGQSVLSDVDGDLLVYHYYDGQDNGTPKLGVNLLSWSGGWPTAY